MIIREDILIILNARNKVQKIKMQLDQHPYSGTYSIFRYTGLFRGKETERPVLQVEQGKVKRTASEQATLQYNALLKHYLDKGYTKLSAFTKKSYDSLTEDEVKAFLGGKFVSDQSGVPKPMLAKLADKCSSSIWDKEWYVSRKLNGTRMLLYYKDGTIMSASRGGGSYNVATKHIRNNPKLLEIFHQSPDLILDGELYHHGVDWPLQRISGLARVQEWKDECAELQYWVYDYVDTKTQFKDRYEVLKAMRGLFDDSDPIKILDQKLMTGYAAIKKEHDKYVQEGFEGLCARNPYKEYGVNIRSSMYLIKLKERKDAEATIIDVKEGLRPEDMCFMLKTPDGIVFAAKPMGDITTRENYLKNKDEYIGKQMTYSYFELSKEGVPCQPVAIHVRPEDE